MVAAALPGAEAVGGAGRPGILVVLYSCCPGGNVDLPVGAATGAAHGQLGCLAGSRPTILATSAVTRLIVPGRKRRTPAPAGCEKC